MQVVQPTKVTIIKANKDKVAVEIEDKEEVMMKNMNKTILEAL